MTGTLLAASVVAAMPAAAAVAPDPGPPAVTPTAPVLSAINSSMWQTNAAVWALAASNGVVYAGGDFTKVRAPGTAVGDVSETNAQHVTAFNTSDGTPVVYPYGTTGKTTIFNHVINGHVAALTVSPDGKTLYVGGDFTAVDNIAHSKIAAFDLTTITPAKGPALLPWTPGTLVNGVRGIAVSADNSSVFIGGDFTQITPPVGAVIAQARVAKLSAPVGTSPTATVDPTWVPSVDGVVDTVLIAPNTNDLIVGGNFDYVNGQPLRALGSLDMTTGANGPLDQLIHTCGKGCGTRSDIKALTTDGTNVYVAAEGTGGGWFDGTLAFNPVTGHQVWYDNCLGATQAIAIVGGVLYDGSHAHDCSAIGGFGQTPITSGPASGSNTGPASWHHLMGEQISDGKLLDWFPTTNPGALNSNGGLPPNTLGPRAMASDGTNLFVAGQFTQVNGVNQQGITRFMGTAPHAKPVAVSNGFAQLLAGNTAVLKFAGTSDPDSGTLTYNVYRDGNYTTPVATYGPVWAHSWTSPLYEFRDTGLTAGAHYYQVDAVDETNQAVRSVKFTASATGVGYQNAVNAFKPNTFWRVSETSGTIAADASGHNSTGSYFGSLNQGIAGAVPNNTAIRLGEGSGIVSNAKAAAGSNTFAIGLWIRTTTTTGGRIIGFGDRQNGTSSNYDRVLYMTNTGQLIFGINGKGVQYLWTPKAYNDGTWHYVVAELDPTYGLRLLVDSVQVAFNNSQKVGQSFNGYWKLGADNLNGWPQRPTSSGITADIDEVTLFGAPLTGTNVKGIMAAE